MSTPSKQRSSGPKIDTRPDPGEMRRHISKLVVPDSCFEIRIVSAWIDSQTRAIVHARKSHGVVSGYYKDVSIAISDLDRVQDIAAYIVQNPVTEALFHRFNQNKLCSIDKDQATGDEHIDWWYRVYLDMDSIRATGISATRDELMPVLERQDFLFGHEPEIRNASIWGCSGNGGWAAINILPLLRKDLHPDDPDSGWVHPDTLVAHLLSLLDSRYSTATVKIDPTTKNASRIGCIAGTYKCKGKHSEERPWRQVTLDSPERIIVPMDLSAYCRANPLDEVASNGRSRSRKGRIVVPATLVDSNGAPLASPVPPSGSPNDDVADRQKRATAYLSAMAPAVSGQNGHGQTFDAACAVVKGFGLNPVDAYGPLSEWNQSCQPPWDDVDLRHKLQDADDKTDDKPRGYLYEGGTGGRQGNTNGFYYGDSCGTGPIDNGKVEGEPGKKFVATEAVDDSHRLAKIFLESEFRHPDGVTLRFYRDGFVKWDGLKYRDISPKQINSSLSGLAKAEFDKQNEIDVRAWIGRGRKNKAFKRCDSPEAPKVTTRLVADVSQAITAYTLLDSHVNSPAWLKDVSDLDPKEIIPCKNGLVHIPSFLSGSNCMTKLTPLFFGTYSLAYDFNPDAPEPVEWLKFLESIWGHDQQSIDTLQEWFGYCLTADTRYQKILGLMGPKRAGKDTIARMLRAMIGGENVVGPTMSGIAGNFGLESWIDMPLAIISDARISGRTDPAVVVERLLTVSGEGTLSIDRKYTSAWNGKLPTRIMIISNELPRLADSSGALASRLIILKLTLSFYGHEDVGLFDRLSRELPGVLNWSIKGWARLRERGRFIQPDSGKGMVDEMEDLGSPIGIFFRDRCIKKAKAEIEVSELYRSWTYWCEANGRKEYGDVQTFGRNMSTLLPDLKIIRKRIGEEHSQRRFYIGIGLNPDFGRSNDPVEPDQSPLPEFGQPSDGCENLGDGPHF